MATFTWNGGSASAADPTQWTPTGNPDTGDTAIILSGDVLIPNDAQLNSNTLEIGSATVSFTGDNSFSFAVPTLDQNTEITSQVTNVSTATATVLDSAGVFVNQGQIIADGPVGSTFTLNITANGTAPGYFINYNQIFVDPGNAMTIAIGANSELFNTGEILNNGGSLFINAATNAIAGGLGPAFGAVVVAGGGTVETNVAYASTIGGASPFYGFVDATAGNTLKIDNVGSFGGLIIGFGANDTIDIANLATLSVTKAVYDQSTGILKLENAGGTTEASLVFASGNFTNGSFNVGTVGNDIVLTTAVQIDTYANVTGSWQTAGNWSNGVPGPLDTALIGFGTKNAFTLDTGATPVSVGQITLASDKATLQITSNTSAGPYPFTLFGGTVDVQTGNTLTATSLRMTGGTLAVDSLADLNLTGHVVTQGVAANNGTISIQTGNTSALRVAGGNVIVTGGTIDAAGTAGAGNIFIGYQGGGTPTTFTVQDGGSGHAGVVTDSYAILASDPTSFGQLTLNGNASWTDTIDTHDAGTTSTGKMLVGFNSQVGNNGTLTPPFSNAATLLVENGATLTDQNLAQIGATADSEGIATVQSGGVWNIGTNGIGVGFLGTGSLSILNGGTVAVGTSGISVGSSATAADGTITVSGTNALLTDAGGLSVGKAGHGLFEVLNNGTVQIAQNGIVEGAGAGSSGTVIVGGSNSPALLNLGTGAGGITVGSSGHGTLEVRSGGTIQLNGTGGILVGQSAGAIGALDVTGPNALITFGTTVGGLTVGSAGQGTGDISNGGTILLNGTGGVGVGTAAGGFGSLEVQSGGALTIAAHGLNIGANATTSTGTVTVTGSGSSITTLGTLGGISVGSPGTGLLDINSGGSVASSAGVFIAGISTSSSGTAMVTGGTLSDTGPFTVGSAGSGTLSVGIGGVVSDTGSFNIGFNGGSSGKVVINGGTVTQSGGGFTVGGSNVAGTLHVGSNGFLTSGGTLGLTDINSSGTGQAAASVSGGTWTVKSQFIVGDFGTGSLSIDSAGVVNAGTNFISIGNQPGGNGTVSVSGGGTLTGGNLSVSNGPAGNANGTLTVDPGGLAQFSSISESGGGTISVNSGTLTSSGGVNIGVGGTGAALTIGILGLVSQTGTSSFQIGSGATAAGTGIVTVNFGGTLTTSGGFGLQIGGGFSGSDGTLTVDGGRVNNTGNFSIGQNGSGTLIVQNNGTVIDSPASSFTSMSVAGPNGAVLSINSGEVSAAGDGFSLGGSNASGTLTLGASGSLITGGTTTLSDISATGTGTAAATINSGAWTSNGQLIIGDTGVGSLTINANGIVNSGTTAVDIGNQAGGNGQVTVGGGNAQFDGGSLFLATPSSSAGTLTVNTGGTVAMAALSIGTGGVLNMGGGTLSAGGLPQINGGISGFGTLIASLNNTGTVVASAGQLVITGSVGGTGVMEIDGGSTMEVDSGLGNTQSVTFVASGSTAALKLDLLAPTTQGFALSNWQNGDELIIGNGQTVTGAVWLGGGTLEVDATGGTYDFTNVSLAGGTTPVFTTTADSVTLVSCFVTGTRVSTLTGEVAVENLREGDLVQVVAGGGHEPIIWVGHRRVDCGHHPKPESVWPVRVSVGAFGPGRPYHDLWLSPDHAIYIGEVLIPVKRLVNEKTIVQVPMDAVIYYHVELPQHTVMLAQGLAVESYLDVGDRTSFANAPGPIALYPDFASRRWDAAGCAPLVVTGPELQAARRWVNGLAGRAMQAA